MSDDRTGGTALTDYVETPQPDEYVAAHGLPTSITFPTLSLDRVPVGILAVLPQALLFGVADPVERQLVVYAAPDDLWAEVHGTVGYLLDDIEAFVASGPGQEQQVYANMLAALASRPPP